MTAVAYAIRWRTIWRRFIRRLKAFNAPGPYGAIGFSMGATVAFRAADEIPELRAVAVDSGPMIFVRDYFNYVLQNKRVKGFLAKKVFLFLYLHVVGFSGMQKRTTACLRRAPPVSRAPDPQQIRQNYSLSGRVVYIQPSVS